LWQRLFGVEGVTALWHDAIMANSAAIVISALVIAAAILFAFRWQAVTTPTQVFRLDRWTGNVTACKTEPMPFLSAGYDLQCEKQ
jgi:hypothetical protein